MEIREIRLILYVEQTRDILKNKAEQKDFFTGTCEGNMLIQFYVLCLWKCLVMQLGQDYLREFDAGNTAKGKNCLGQLYYSHLKGPVSNRILAEN